MNKIELCKNINQTLDSFIDNNPELRSTHTYIADHFRKATNLISSSTDINHISDVQYLGFIKRRFTVAAHDSTDVAFLLYNPKTTKTDYRLIKDLFSALNTITAEYY